MKKVGSAFAALSALAWLSAPASARTTLADFRGSGEAMERLLAHVHKHKKLKIVVRKPGDDTDGPGTSTDTTTATGVPPDVSIDPR